jgi:hypothetical protein
VVAAKVFWQPVQRKRRSLWEWALMLPWPSRPLAGQPGLGQDWPWGSMA